MMASVIITGEKHLCIPNHPRNSRHKLIYSKPFPSGRYPLEKIWSPLGSISSWQPTLQKINLVHSFNKIPYTNKPWFLTFEDHSFLYLNSRNQLESLIYTKLHNRLGLENCKKLIAISDYGKMRFLNWIQELHGYLWEKVVNKVHIIHPNFPIRATHPKKYNEQRKLQLVFVGNHIARKGGIVALRLAKKAEKLKLPVVIHIISGLKHGSGVPTDFPEPEKYTEDLKLLDLNNIVYHKILPNAKVIDLLKESDFQILATLHDTYGYSVIEGFSVATPAITTNVCALPEFVRDQENGYILHLELNERRHWNNWLHGDKTKTIEYWDIVNSTYEELANQALQRVLEFLDRPDKNEHYEFISSAALAQATNVNNSEKQNELFDNLYAEASKV
jgi:glycosyltransferase involved in cell wall biosynthesis